MAAGQGSGERYSMGYGDAAHAFMMRRTLAGNAEFLLPYLAPGQRLLDVGCGPGSITVDLAEAVAPGEVVGLDLALLQLERARAYAVERGVGNVRFEPGSAYDLPFPDAGFDLVFATSLLEHLGDPPRALREFRRVLRPGGLVAIQDPDWTLRVWEPHDARLERLSALWIQVYEHNGGSPAYARTQRRLLLEAGFARAETSAAAARGGTTEQTRGLARFFGAQFRSWRDLILTQGWADVAELDEIDTALAAWGERPDATQVFFMYRSLGWVDPL